MLDNEMKKKIHESILDRIMQEMGDADVNDIHGAIVEKSVTPLDGEEVKDIVAKGPDEVPMKGTMDDGDPEAMVPDVEIAHGLMEPADGEVMGDMDDGTETSDWGSPRLNKKMSKKRK